LARKARVDYARRVKTTVLVAALAAGCLGPRLQLPEPQTASTPALGDDSKAPGARPARAFAILRAEDRLDGPAADGRVGDYRLDNDRIAVIVSAPARRSGFSRSGGNLIDAAPAGGHDALRQIYGYLGDSFPRQPIYNHVDVLNERGTGVIVARGHDSDDPRILVETRYSLAPGSDAVAIDTTLSNGGDKPLEHFAIGDAVEWGRAERFIPGRGLDAAGHFATDAGWVEGIADSAAYAYVIAEGALDARHGWASSEFNTNIVDLPPGASVRVTRWFVVGSPTDARRYETIAALRKQRWARLSGRILEESTAATLPDARVFFDDRDGPLAVMRSTVHGYEVFVPPGDYHVRAEGVGRSGPQRLDVTVEPTASATHDVMLSRRGILAFRVRENGTTIPAKLTVFGIAPTLDPRFGPPFASPGGNVLVSAGGEGELPLPPGRYRIIASRGPAYTIDDERVEIPAGSRAQLDFGLQRAVDGFGWRCLDPHQHAFPSSDSAVSLGDRAATNLAEGFDVMVATDHNLAASEWTQAIAEQRPARPLALIVGDEVSIDQLADFGVVPLGAGAAVGSEGVPDPHNQSLAELVRSLKAPDRVLILNHPRGERSYFDNTGFDPRTGNLKDLVTDFDAIEIFSSKDVSKVEPALRDWMALLDRGVTFTAVGGSDTHLVVGQETGYPRTCVPADDKDELTADAFVAAVKRRREALVTNGPFVRVSVAGRGMGQLAPAPRGRARLDVEVEAAPWIDVRRLELFVNGTRRGKPFDIPASTKPLRYKAEIDLRIERDAYVVVVVRGDAPLGPVVPPSAGQSPPTALAITNPIYLDRDGDGHYTPSEAASAPHPH
jgi:hypothetical protein